MSEISPWAPIPRPATDEYEPYYGTYVDKVDCDGPVLDLLETQQAEVQTLLASVDDERGDFRYAEGKWSIKEVVGHIVDTERVFAYRALCFARGESQPLPGMDQDDFVEGGDFGARRVRDLALEYQASRRSTLTLFAGFSNLQLGRRGVASGCEFTARAIAYIIAGHERHHLMVLRERYDL
jgi:hypothetical protein